MKTNSIETKSFAFAIRIVRLYHYLCNEKQESVLSKQLLRSGTSIGALIRDTKHAKTKAEFIHKTNMVEKDIYETIYWLELLNETGYLAQDHFESLHSDANDIIDQIAAMVKAPQLNTRRAAVSAS